MFNNEKTIKDSKCMICQAQDFEFVHSLRDDTTRNVYRCQKCGHIQIAPLPTPEEDFEFYQSSKMYESAYKNRQEFKDKFKDKEKLADRYREYSEYEHKKLINYLHKDWKILEIGSSYGWLVEYMQNLGYDFDGVEISSESRELYRKRTGKELKSFNFLTDDLKKLNLYEQYDCICCFQTLEHIDDPIYFLKAAAQLLKPGGMVYIDVPNQDDHLLPFSEGYENFHYCRVHLSYFYPHTLKKVLELSGFDNIEIIGNQIYSIENASQWLRHNEPFHEYHQIEMPESIQWINKIYKDKLESELKSNAIIAIGTKK